MTFKFSKNQAVQASAIIELQDSGDIYPGRRGQVKAHRVDASGNLYLVKFKRYPNYVQVREDQLSKV